MTKNIYAGSNMFCNRLKLVALKDRWLKCKTRQEYIANPKFTTNIIFVYKFILFNFKSLGLRNERNSQENNDKERKLSIITILTIKTAKIGVRWFHSTRGIRWWWFFYLHHLKKVHKARERFFFVWFYVFWTNLRVFWVERLVY